MDIVKKRKDGCEFIKVENSITIYEVGELKKSLLDSFGKKGGIILDLKGVEKCDSAGVQLLVSARKTASEKDRRFEIDGYSANMAEAFLWSGLSIEAVLE